MIDASSDHIVALHRGFAELPEPTRPFQQARAAAHIDLPLEAKPPTDRWSPLRALPPTPRPIPFVDKATCDAAHAQRMHTDRQRDLLRAAHAAGHDSGLVEGYWRGGRHGLLLGVVLGTMLGVLGGLAIGLRMGLLP